MFYKISIEGVQAVKNRHVELLNGDFILSPDSETGVNKGWRLAIQNHSGYESITLHVTVAPDEGRELTVSLEGGPDRPTWKANIGGDDSREVIAHLVMEAALADKWPSTVRISSLAPQEGVRTYYIPAAPTATEASLMSLSLASSGTNLCQCWFTGFEEFEVVFAGVGPGPECPNCDAVNGRYVIPFNDIDIEANNECTWYGGPASGCDFVDIELNVGRLQSECKFGLSIRI